jgi:hypothetical protein
MPAAPHQARAPDERHRTSRLSRSRPRRRSISVRGTLGHHGTHVGRRRDDRVRAVRPRGRAAAPSCPRGDVRDGGREGGDRRCVGVGLGAPEAAGRQGQSRRLPLPGGTEPGEAAEGACCLRAAGRGRPRDRRRHRRPTRRSRRRRQEHDHCAQLSRWTDAQGWDDAGHCERTGPFPNPIRAAG